MSIYRYRKIDKKNLDAWANNQLWFSPLHMLDDAFEMWCHFDSKGFSTYNSTTQKAADNYLNKFIEEKKITSTFCCFSKNPDIPLMWARYGDSLAGVCVEYDENILELNQKKLVCDEIHTVDYPLDEKLPHCDIHACHKNDLNGQGHNAYGPAFKALFLTKSRDWSHQEEVRLIWENPAGLDGGDASQGIPVNRDAIKSIIFGERADPDKVKLVKDIFGSEMTYKIARRSKTHYKIEMVDHPSP